MGKSKSIVLLCLLISMMHDLSEMPFELESRESLSITACKTASNVFFKTTFNDAAVSNEFYLGLTRLAYPPAHFAILITLCGFEKYFQTKC